MFKRIQVSNFKALRQVDLQLRPFNVVLGPNGSGKTTLMQAFEALGNPNFVRQQNVRQQLSAGVPFTPQTQISISVDWGDDLDGIRTSLTWSEANGEGPTHKKLDRSGMAEQEIRAIQQQLSSIRRFMLDPTRLAQPVPLRQQMEVDRSGTNLAGVLDSLRDEHPERFEALNTELAKMVPEFDRILFETPSDATRAIMLRTRAGGHAIRAADLSHGTILTLAILTISFLPTPPAIICLEEPEHGLHPRLLRGLSDALFRITEPTSGRRRTQVLVSTHSPYFLDLFRDQPDLVLIASKQGLEARFERLSERKDLAEITENVRLGDAWYAGVLGGVPTEPVAPGK